MATQNADLSFGSESLSLRVSFPWRHGFFAVFLFGLFLQMPASFAQLQSALVFASAPQGVAVYTRNDATGNLSQVAGSPFRSREAATFLALDFKGR